MTHNEEVNQTNFMQTVPNSHFWTSIEMLLNFLNGYKNGDVSANYLIIGLQNTRNKGYQIALPESSPSPVQGVRWVKASERLPETGIGRLNYLWVRNMETKCGCMHPLESFLKLDGIENTEWLEESPLPTSGKGSEEEERLKKEMYENMQYYMEYCERNGYVTPMEWIEKHKHF